MLEPLPAALSTWLDALCLNNVPGFFVTGTDTDVGKTHVSALLLQALSDPNRKPRPRLAPRKPIASGCLVDTKGQLWSEDIEQLYQACRRQVPRDTIGRHLYQPAISPARAIEQAGDALTLSDLTAACDAPASALRWVEGAGGFYSPLTPEALNADLACALNLPVLLVVANRLGCLNHSLLTLQAIQHRGLTVAGVVLNDVQPDADPDNAHDLARRLPASTFFCHLPHQAL